MAAASKNLIGWSIGLFIMTMSLASCEERMTQCGLSEEIKTGLEDTEKMTSLEQVERIPEVIQKLFQKHPAKTLEELSLKYEYLLKYHFYFGPGEKVHLYIDSLEMVSSPDDQDCYRGRSTMLFVQAYLEDEKGGSILDIIELHEEGKNYSDRFKEKCRFLLNPLTIARIYDRQQKYNEAIQNLKEELRRMENCNKFKFRSDFANNQALLNSIGVYYERMMNLDSAEFYYLKALSFIEKHTSEFVTWDNFSKIAEGVVKGNLGGIYMHQGKYELAETYLIESIDINDNPGMADTDAFLTKIKLADLYFRSNRIGESILLIKKLEKETTLLEYLDFRSRLGKLASSIYKHLGQYEESLDWLEQYKAAEDDLKERFEHQRTKDIEEKIAHVNQTRSYELLERKSALKTRNMWGLAVAGFLFLALIMVLWIKRKEQKKHIASLSKLHDQLVLKNRELITSLSDLQMSQEENKRMLKVLAHDLRTPIAAMVNMADLINMVEITEAERAELIQLQKESGLSLLSLIKDLLSPDLKGNHNKAPVDMKALIESCVTTLKTLASEKNIRFHIEGPEVVLMGHREKLWRMISNILSNAIKFSHDHSEIFITLEKNSEWLYIRIKDQGIGIPEDMLDTLFTLPTNSGRPGTQGEKSFGMGLAICKQIVDLHDGNISCQSQVNKGSTFIIELPIV